ncbi:Long-chain-fatty-acid--CoA ligase [Fulvivirga imtechensis AK7]|uniref:Long-chain-fatty-acid--CoA ligase n=2 Tax=Fulvivirga TaxID=396811 RepID=L8JVR8_9BACT|nr:Long-chain-fatty-acid--CoA ligase [Fulvivirga imtechensis AK7]
MEVAVIGMAGRFPGANNIYEFWKNVRDGVESISFFNEEELLAEGVDKSLLDDPRYVRANAYLQDKEYYDSVFFDKLPDEASLMEPQIRVFQQCLWQAMEDAGYNVYDYDAKIGLFAGGTSNINWMNYALIANQRKLLDDFTVNLLSDIQFLCTSTSYLFNLRGPSIYINTACSTSLVAIQRATVSLLLQECSMAIAGGVTINNYSKKGHLYQEGMIFSRDGHCRTFDANATGTVGGEGVGVVVLKRLKDALRDGDNIHAVIKGAGINNDGYNKVGYTAPSIEGQCEAILKAQKMAKVEKESIGYIEAHGTGTVLGDPIEVEALNLAFGKSTVPYCALGSVKSNIGHLDAAAGVAGFIKTVLALKYKQIPASLHFEKPNPKIDFNNSPFYVNTKLRNWENDKYPLRAGVSSFGIGGTNAHIILEEAPAKKTSSLSRPYQLLTISAKTATALKSNTGRLKEYLVDNKNINTADIAYTLNTCRASFKYKKVLVCRTRDEMIEQLDFEEESNQPTTSPSEERISNVFMFPGQGMQYVKMCTDLFQYERVFKEEVEKCFRIIQSQSGKDIQSVLFLDEKGMINETEFTQPALFIVEYALARLLMSWGISPDIMIGHSIGEYVAACLSGVFSLEDALFLVIKRGELMQRAPKGAMLSILITEQELNPYLSRHKEVSLAAVNSFSSCVVSGPTSAINTFKANIEHEGFKCKEVLTSHAFHSHMMDSVLTDFKQCVGKVKISSPGVPFVSNVTGKIAGKEILNHNYWVDQLRQTIRFSEGIAHVINENANVVFLEVGPGNALSSFVGSNEHRGVGHKTVNLLGKSKEGVDTLYQLLKGLGKLWMNGLEPNWSGYYSEEARHKVSLPSYSFDRIAYPVDVDANQMIREMFSERSGVRKDIGDWFYTPRWEIQPQEGLTEKKKFNVLFIEDSSLAELFREKFGELEEDFVFVKKGVSFGNENARLYHLDPLDHDGYVRLFKELKSVVEPMRIVFAWGVNKSDKALTIERAKNELDEGYYALLNIAKGLGKAYITKAIQIVSITSNLHHVLHGDIVSPEKSPILAAVKVIPKEYENISCRNIDITYTDNEQDTSVVPVVIREVFSKCEHQIVALRRGTKFVQTIKPAKVARENSDIPFVSGGNYLITGGLGGIGLTLSRHISENIKGVNLILLGRKDLPAKDRWSWWLNNHDQKDTLYTIISELLKIEENGSNVTYISMDVSDVDGLRKVVDDLESELGKINGIIHAAGLGDYAGFIQKREKENNEKVFSPKIYGTIALCEVFKHREPEFLVFCSSLSSQIAPVGQVGYVAANLFMESFTESYAFGGSRVICIGWNQWRTVGMAAAEIIKNGQTYLENSISPEEGYKLLLKCTESDLHTIYISNTDPTVYNEFESNHEVPGLDADVITEEDSGNLESKVIKVWHDFFGRADIGLNDDFFESGGDSLKALTLVSRINRELHLEIPLSHFIERSSVRELCDYIAEVYDRGSSARSQFITPAREKDHYELSPAQQRLYFLYELDKTSLAYNMPQTVLLEGKLDVERLSNAFNKLINRHESLRTAFHDVYGCTMQKIEHDADFDVEVIQANSEDVDELQRSFVRPFDLSKAPLLRVRLVMLTQEKYLLMVDKHHIVADGVSQAILIKDFMALYNEEELPELQLQYKDYSEWQLSDEQQVQISDQRDFWKHEFSDEVSVLNLPTDFPRPQMKGYHGDHLSFVLDQDTTRKLRKLGEESGATMFMMILSVLNVLLSKLSNQEDIVVGTSVAGRYHPDLEGIIGMFVNTLALRNFPKSELSFRDFLSQVKQKTFACLDNQFYPYEILIDELKVRRDTSRNPLFDVGLTFQNFDYEELAIPGITLRPYEETRNVSKFDIELWVAEVDEKLHLNFEYSTELFKHETIARFVAYFQRIVEVVTVDFDRKLSEIDILSSDEQHQLLVTFNETETDYPREHTIIDLFEDQVHRTPDNIAVWYKEDSLTYRELMEKSDRIAIYLQQEIGVQVGDRVGLLLERDADLMPSIFGILKSGAAYVPLSPSHPSARVNGIISDADLKALISRGHHLGTIGVETSAQLIDLDEASEMIDGQPPAELVNKPKGDDLAYVIYTSGSTGTPKGVMIEHHSVVNRLLWMQKAYPIGSNDVLLQKTPLSFDVSIWELFWWSMVGASVSVLAPEEEKDPSKVIEAIDKYKVSVVHFVPSMLTLFLQELDGEEEASLSSLSHVFCSGEALGSTQVKFFGRTLYKRYATQLINLYGPTEATVDVSYYNCGFNEIPASIPIGKPIDNTKLYILDKDGRLCAIGVRGELCISGSGLARGYIHADQLTAERFVPNPFEPGERLYKTGDLACWLPDGNIEYIGRKDYQVKIRGLRIELGEIESQLVAHQGIKEAVVLVREREDNKFLVGYYVARKEIPSSDLRNHLSQTLPEYMIPVYYVQLDRMPLTTNGKVDRKALPNPEIKVGEDYVAPCNETEEKLAEIWSEVLSIEKGVISVNKSFFELGGNSIKILHLKSLLKRKADIKISVPDLFNYTTISSLTEFIVNGELINQEVEKKMDQEITGMDHLIKNYF